MLKVVFIFKTLMRFAVLFSILTVFTLAEVWAFHSLLEAFAVLLLALRAAAIAAFVVTKLLCDWVLLTFTMTASVLTLLELFEDKLALGKDIISLNHVILLFEFWTESKRVAHQDLLFSKSSSGLMLWKSSIFAALASTLPSTVTIVLKALTVELQAAWAWAIAVLWQSIFIVIVTFRLSWLVIMTMNWSVTVHILRLLVFLHLLDDFLSYLSSLKGRFVHFSTERSALLRTVLVL